MPYHSFVDPNAGVAEVVAAILKRLEQLDWQQEAPDVFLVYAHDNDTIGKPADADIARRLIGWLGQVGANIYSDRTGMGNPPIPKATPSDTQSAHDIVSSQLGLLPTNHFVRPKDKRQKIILCGSALLGHYIASDYYQHTYYLGFKAAYQSAQQQASPADAKRILSNYVNSQLNTDGFHHVLTELACLQLRNENEPDSHFILPVALNDSDQAVFPDFVINSTTIRIIDAAYREPGSWQGQPTYQDQGLHEGFFKLLDRLWENKSRMIQVIVKDVYSSCLQKLRTQSLSEKALASIIEQAIEESGRRLISKGNADLRILLNQEWLHRFEVAATPAAKTLDIETSEIQQALKKTLGNRLAIKRISSDSLPMSRCYINLAIIEYQPKQQEEQNQTMREQEFQRLSSAEFIPSTNLKERIPLEELFRPRELESGIMGIPRRILIRGRAGVGKTTLAKKSVYGYLQEALWKSQFDWVLWVPLRHLKGEAGHYQLETLLYEEYFKGYGERGRALANALYCTIQKDPYRALFILDGWDEVAQEKTCDGLIALLNHPSVIITSRPYGVSFGHIDPVDLELETVGFNEENVMAYLDHPTIVNSNVAPAIKAFIKQHPFVRELVNIPIQLDALCYSWDEIKKGNELVHTMTGLYEAMVTKLWRKDTIRLEKTVDGKLLTSESVNHMRPRSIKRVIHAESSCLGALALNQLERDQILFEQTDVYAVIDRLEDDGHPMTESLASNMNKLSCLQVESDDRFKSLSGYQFLHLTFQEFFGAQWLVDCFIQDRPLSLQKDPTMKSEAFIQQHKYNPRYEIMWRFVAGLCPKEALPAFFDHLEKGTQDLIGMQHQHLIVHMLKETMGKLSTALQESLESRLGDWLGLELEERKFGVLWIHSPLASQDAFPDAILLKQLEEENISYRHKNIIISILMGRHTLSTQTIYRLLNLLQCKSDSVRIAASHALRNKSALPPKAVDLLLARLEDEDSYVREVAVRVLGKQFALPPKAAELLLARLEDEHSDVRLAVVRVLEDQSVLPPKKAVDLLLARLEDEDRGVGWAAIEALGKKSALPPKAVEWLLAHLEDEDRTVREVAVQTLGKHSSLPPKAVDLLLARLEDDNHTVRREAAQILGNQSSLPPKAVDLLLAHLEDEDRTVREVAVQTLGKHSSLPPKKAVDLLVARLEDEDRIVRWKAAEALGKQSALPPKAVDLLVARLADEDSHVRQVAAEALGKQSALPPKTVEWLVARLEDEDSSVKEVAEQALERHITLEPETIQMSIACLEDEDGLVRWRAVQSLMGQSPLPTEAFQSLTARLEDDKLYVRMAAIAALGKQLALSPNTIQSIKTLYRRKDEKERLLVIQCLRRQSSLPVDATQFLLTCLKSEDANIKHGIAQILGRQSSLSLEVTQSLIDNFEHQDGKVREVSAWILRDQSLLASEAIQSLIAYLEHQDKYVRWAAAWALGTRSPLSAEITQHLIDCLDDKEENVRDAAVSSLGMQYPLPSEAIPPLTTHLKGEYRIIKKGVVKAFNYHSFWHLSASVLKNPEQFNQLYRFYFIRYSFEKIFPFYLQDNLLYFYDDSQLTSILLNEKTLTQLRQSIWQAQTHARIPPASRITLTAKEIDWLKEQGLDKQKTSISYPERKKAISSAMFHAEFCERSTIFQKRSSFIHGSY